MRRLDLSVMVLIALAVGASLSIALAQGRPPIDWIFATVIFSAALLVGRRSWLAFRAAARQRDIAAGLDGLDVHEAARLAVVEERRLLSSNIEVSLRESLTRVASVAAALIDEADPRPSLALILAETNRATTDLRRQLGLLRAEDEVVPAPRTPAEPSPGRLRRGDWLLTAGTVVLAGAELAILHPLEQHVLTLPEIALTLAAATTVIGRRIAPEAAGLACAGIFAVGAWAHQPVQDGFWFALTIGMLAWSCAARATWRAWLVIVLLAGCAVGSRLLSQADAVGLLIALFAVAVAGGATVGRSRRRQGLACARADAREDELRAASAEAVAAERRMVARELHDVVSHAVSVIAVQAGAAEMSWPIDPATARGAMNVVLTVAEQTLTELDRLLPGRTALSHDVADVQALVDRMRAAGLEVTLEVSGEPHPPIVPTVYRVIQEALTNALRHAPGSHVRVRIDRSADDIIISVADDGPGSAPDSRRGYGLIGLAERLRQAGGTLVIRSTPEVPGFEVTAVLPDRSVVSTP